MAQKTKFAVMRHGETEYIFDLEKYQAKLKAEGFDYDTLTDEERAQHEKEFQHHAMRAEYIDAMLSENGRN